MQCHSTTIFYHHLNNLSSVQFYFLHSEQKYLSFYSRYNANRNDSYCLLPMKKRTGLLPEHFGSANSKQYMWVYRTSKHSEKQIVIYDYKNSKSGDAAKKFLEDFSGYLHTDGYAGCNKLTKVTHCNCWVHLRRKFHEAIFVDGVDSIAKTGRGFCLSRFRASEQKPDFRAYISSPSQ